MHYLLFYEKSADFAQRELAYQTAHRAHVFAAVDRGELILGGPLTDSTNGTNVLLFQCNSAITVDAFARADPYVLHGIVVRWQVRPWQTVVGPAATCPMTRGEPGSM